MSPTPSDKPVRRSRTRRAEPAEQGTWLDLGPDGDAPGEATDTGAPVAAVAIPEEPEWLREAPAEADAADLGPALSPEDAAAAIEATALRAPRRSSRV